MGETKLGLRIFVILAILIFSYYNLLTYVDPLENQHCDPYIENPVDNEFGYGPRNGRCEGIYFRVSWESLLLVSFTEYFEEYGLDSGQNLTVEWTSPNNEPVHLRAKGLIPLKTEERKSRIYYRMDSVQERGIASFRWPIDILRELRITSRDIGVVGWTSFNLGKSTNKLYLPLRIKRVGNVTRSLSYKVAILPERELREVSYSIAQLKDNGKLGKFEPDSKKLEYGYYPADRVFEFSISLPDGPGIYFLEIGATLRSGGVDTIELWIHQSR